MTSIVAQRKAAIEAQLKANSPANDSRPPTSAPKRASTDSSPYKNYNIKRVRKVSQETKRGWGFTKTTYVIKHEQPNSTNPSLAPKVVPQDLPSQNSAQRPAPPPKASGRLHATLPQEAEMQPPVENVYYSDVPETVSLQYSEHEDFEDLQPRSAALTENIDQSRLETFRSASDEQPSNVTASQRPHSIQRTGNSATYVPSLPERRKPVVREMADTNPSQDKEYEGSWQAKRMLPPQPHPGMPTPDMAAAAAEKYNKNKDRIQKAVRKLEGEEDPAAKRGLGCCVIL
ncbi:hypothetical protein FisN_2Lh352 [Fistulifera solaris]|uniref:Uncharacterized protein n=1 Tax=Fistulifera solaris TaxID=1519565 RepID=A0A1Z5J7W0_FISSO|nr:hypothetical protein FisN_2Lh352 [Fistulifera solaris]|eukprot:GAX10083.1 hypothetical protein FisN_2Lh352 [Fistulifera solaris]